MRRSQPILGHAVKEMSHVATKSYLQRVAGSASRRFDLAQHADRGIRTRRVSWRQWRVNITRTELIESARAQIGDGQTRCLLKLAFNAGAILDRIRQVYVLLLLGEAD